ncbi:MAG: Holliday junction branch migration protein RuvA [Vicinamibacteria bacterium]|jgi:Holliday junction DNA helicase RuvA|nr:Holliday junction branch migration protein RuvA [Vicinamibacteria bacterium]
MIGFLRGVLLHKTPQELLIDVGGVGYKVQAPISTFCRLGDQGAQAQLLIHTHVREDQLVLYGFLTNTELELFEKLISVSGVGPKVALGVLSGIEADDLVHAIRANDVARLTRVPGVGKKTAERLILELKDKIGTLLTTTAEPTAPSPQRSDLLSALRNLGYSPAEADRAATEALRLQPEATLGELLRGALRLISRR